MGLDLDAMKEQWVGHEFDEATFEIKSDRVLEFNLVAGETEPRFTDPSDPDFHASPVYSSFFAGHRVMPEGFDMSMANCFDAGKCVETHGPMRPGDVLTGRSQIHDLYVKTGRTGGMFFVVHRMNFTNQNDELVSTVDWRLVKRMGADEL